MSEIYRYSFAEGVDLDAVEASLVMAFLGAEALYGESQVRMDGSYAFERELRSCVVDACTVVGRDINRLFTGYLRREFGPEQFTVYRLPPHEAEAVGAAA
jgi:hypothetical protein